MLGAYLELMDAHLEELNDIIDRELIKSEKEKAACVWIANLAKMCLQMQEEFDQKKIGM